MSARQFVARSLAHPLPRSRPSRPRRVLVLAGLVLLAAVALPAASRAAERADDRSSIVEDLRSAYAAADWPRALKAAERLLALDREDPLGWYDVACMRTRAGDVKGALEAIARSADLGLDRLATLLRDEDLDGLRQAPGFAAVLTRVRANSEASLARFRKRAEREARVVTVLPDGEAPRHPAPLLVALHGRGGNAAVFVGALAEIARARGAVLIAPQGVDRVGRGFGWGRLEEGEYLVQRAIERVKKEQRIDPERIVVVGFSQGGATASVLGVRHGEGIAGVVALAGGDDPRVILLPDAPGSRLPRFALFAGGDDPAAGEARAFGERLERAGAEVWIRIEAGLGHNLPRDPRTLGEAVDFALGRPGRDRPAATGKDR